MKDEENKGLDESSVDDMEKQLMSGGERPVTDEAEDGAVETEKNQKQDMDANKDGHEEEEKPEETKRDKKSSFEFDPSIMGNMIPVSANEKDSQGPLQGINDNDSEEETEKEKKGKTEEKSRTEESGEEKKEEKKGNFKAKSPIPFNNLRENKSGTLSKNVIGIIVIGVLIIFLGFYIAVQAKTEAREEAERERNSAVTRDGRTAGIRTDVKEENEPLLTPEERKMIEELGGDPDEMERELQEARDREKGIKRPEAEVYQAVEPEQQVAVEAPVTKVPVYNQAAAKNTAKTLSESDIEALKSTLRKDGSIFPDSNNITKAVKAEEETVPALMSKDEYIAQKLKEYESVLNTGGNGKTDIEEESVKQGAITVLQPNTIYPGTIISAALISAIDTDDPNAGITARVVSPVYDSKTGRYLLIPAGSILRGSYGNTSFGQKTVQIAWEEVVINRDGTDFIVELGSMAGVNNKGAAGIKGSVDEHYFNYVKALGLMSAVTVLNSELYYYSNAASNNNTRQIIGDGQSLVNELGNNMINRTLNINPTIRIPNGTRINVEVNAPITLFPFEKDAVTEKFKR